MRISEGQGAFKIAISQLNETFDNKKVPDEHFRVKFGNKEGQITYYGH